MDEEARESAWRGYKSLWDIKLVPSLEAQARYDFLMGWSAGVVTGRMQAREAVETALDELLDDMDSTPKVLALEAIDGLTT